jgi:hypothetical protein
MPVELPYLPSYKNVEKLFEKIATAKQPEAFTHGFLSDVIGLKSTTDRPLIPLLRTLGFIDAAGKPTPEYGALKNPDRAGAAMATAIRRAYEPLFAANEKANTLSGEQLKGLIAQVAGTDANMTTKIVGTLNALLKRADFTAPNAEKQAEKLPVPPAPDRQADLPPAEDGLRTEFHYNIQVHLPSNADEETYLSIFNALRRAFR